MSEISWCGAGASAGQPEIVATHRCCGRGSLGGVSYDFAVIPVDLITSPEQAARLDVAMCEEVKQPAPRDVEEFVAELHRKYGFDTDEDHCFLSVESVPDARGTVVASSWQSVPFATTELLRMTRDFGFALYDPQRLRLYDPRDHIDIDVELGDGTQVPYLSERLLAGLFDRPDPRWPWLIVRRDEHHYIQSIFMEGRAVVIEHRRGGPDQHFSATTSDRQLAQRILWNWATQTPGWEECLSWQRVEIGADT